MPRIRQFKDQYAQSDLMKEIDSRCVWAGYRTTDSLGKALGVTGMTVCNFKKEPGSRQISMLQSIVKVLNPNPGVMLRFLGYSNQEIRKFAKDYISN